MSYCLKMSKKNLRLFIKLLITAVYRSQFHDNVYPIVYANDYNTKKLVVEAMANSSHCT